MRMLYRITCRFLRIVFGTFYRWRVRGVERLPERGGCVVVANHCNFGDPLVLGSALYPRRIIRFMAKAEIFGWPILGALVKRLHAFPVRRGAFDRQAVKSALEVVQAGHCLGLFPEGTRFHDGRLHELRGGAAMVHLATGAPVLPVGLAGTEKMKLFWWPRLAVWIGEPIALPKTEGLPEREEIAAINEAIREGLAVCLVKARALKAGSRSVTAG